MTPLPEGFAEGFFAGREKGEKRGQGEKRGRGRFILPVASPFPILAGMPRGARDSLGGYCYHVLNRGNARRTVFHKDGDYIMYALRSPSRRGHRSR
jgi:hypothetical protein